MQRRIDLTPQQTMQLKNAELQMAMAKAELNTVLAGILAAASIDGGKIEQVSLAKEPHLLVDVAEQA